MRRTPKQEVHRVVKEQHRRTVPPLRNTAQSERVDLWALCRAAEYDRCERSGGAEAREEGEWLPARLFLFLNLFNAAV